MVVKDGTCKRESRSNKFLMIVSATDGWIFIFRRMSRKEYGGVISLGKGSVFDGGSDSRSIVEFGGTIDSSIGDSVDGVKDGFEGGMSVSSINGCVGGESVGTSGDFIEEGGLFGATRFGFSFGRLSGHIGGTKYGSENETDDLEDDDPENEAEEGSKNFKNFKFW